MNRVSIRWTVSLGVSALLLAACHHAPPPVVAPPAGPNADSARLARERADSIARAEEARRAAAAAEAARADSARRAAEAARLAEERAHQAITAPIHFEYDRAEILDADRSLMDQKSTVLTANHPLQIRIEGNTDERGSDEYNLALGMRRASAARRYLIEHGVDSAQVGVTSNGEEHPVCQDHDESCWSQNRRDEFVITAGGNQLVVHP